MLLIYRRATLHWQQILRILLHVYVFNAAYTTVFQSPEILLEPEYAFGDSSTFILSGLMSFKETTHDVYHIMIGIRLPILDILLGIIVTPLIVYVVQLNRYTIFEDLGCRLPLFKTALVIVLIPGWRLAISLISGIHGVKDTLLSFRRTSLHAQASTHITCVLREKLSVDLWVFKFGLWSSDGHLFPWPGWTRIHSCASIVDCGLARRSRTPR
jgi:hypothetical protein